MKIALLYHRADFDGLLSREVCLHFLKQRYENPYLGEFRLDTFGWDYGDPIPDADWRSYDNIYIVDLSVDELMARPELRHKLIVIDHHASAIGKWDAAPSDHCLQPINGYRIDGVAACRLCWQWFTRGGDPSLPEKQEFIDRLVQEPELIRLAGMYDVWDLRDPNAEPLQFGLRALSELEFSNLVETEFSAALNPVIPVINRARTESLDSAITAGRGIQAYVAKMSREYATDNAHTLYWEGLCWCSLNIGQRGNSKLLEGGIKPEHDACIAWRYTGRDFYVSLYHITGHEQHDLSLIATKMGGGGHKGACGFRTKPAGMAELLKLTLPPEDRMATPAVNLTLGR